MFWISHFEGFSYSRLNIQNDLLFFDLLHFAFGNDALIPVLAH